MVGNIPNYTPVDILRAFLLVEDGISRAEIKKKLSLGEGSVRSILNNLKIKGIITSSKEGHKLTEKGRDIKKEFYQEIGEFKNIHLKELNPLFKRGVVVKNFDTKRSSIELRDIAIKNNADGALILRYGKDLEMPDSEVDFFKNFRESYEELLNAFDINPGNTLVVVFAKSQSLATNALLALVVAMNTKIRKIYEQLVS